MEKTVGIKRFGKVYTDDVSMEDAQITLFIPVYVADGSQLEVTMDRCKDEYVKEHNVCKEDDLHFCFQLVLNFGSYKFGSLNNTSESDYTLNVIIWHDEDENGNDGMESYDDIPIDFDDDDDEKVKEFIMQGIRKALFEK